MKGLTLYHLKSHLQVATNTSPLSLFPLNPIWDRPFAECKREYQVLGLNLLVDSLDLIYDIFGLIGHECNPMKIIYMQKYRLGQQSLRQNTTEQAKESSGESIQNMMFKKITSTSTPILG